MSNIQESLEKIKPFYGLLVIILIASIFFALGRISVARSQNSPINISNTVSSLNTNQTATAIKASTKIFTSKNESLIATPPRQDLGGNGNVASSTSGVVIGSKSGKKYYFPWCGTVKRIKLENQVKFVSTEEAKKAGFVPGGNCKGLK